MFQLHQNTPVHMFYLYTIMSAKFIYVQLNDDCVLIAIAFPMILSKGEKPKHLIPWFHKDYNMS